MNSEIFQECEASFYRELYHMKRPGQSAVVNETTGKLGVLKKMQHYDRAVYEYLRAHRNPHIPEIYSIWDSGGGLTVVEEYIQGETLSDLLQRNALTWEQKKGVLLQLCDALAFLHSADPPIIHRDIKPENIMVTRHGTVMLIDYDAAKVYHAGKGSDTVLLGTEGSAAPEQYGFRQSDARTDIYGMGVLIETMFASDLRMLKIAGRATEMEPARRYPSAEKLKAAIEDVRGESAGRKRPSAVNPANTGSTEKKRPRINIPGFRTLKPWKMLIAGFVYFFMLDLCLTLELDNVSSAAELWADRLIVLGWFFSTVDLFTDWTPLFRKFPYYRGDSGSKRALHYILGAVCVFLFWCAVLLIVTEMFRLM